MKKVNTFYYISKRIKSLFKVIYLAILFIAVSYAYSTMAKQKENPNLIEVEYQFAEATKNSTIKEGFLKFIDDEGILFRPHPVNGKEFLEKSPAAPGQLLWYPSFSKKSHAGDLGVNAGPWEFKRVENEESVAFGNFVTVWEKQNDGSWKFLIDMGNSNAKPEKAIEPLKVQSNFASENIDVKYDESEYKDLVEIEKSVNKKSYYKDFVDSETMAYRNNYFPFYGLTILDHLSENPENHKWETLGGKISASNDFGYTYGKAAYKKDENPALAYYLHVWKKDAENNWKLLVDVLNEVPKQSNE